MSSAGPTAGLPVMEATEAYEAWLRKRLDVVEADLQYKHQQMAASLFAFLRGTFYRWAALWEETFPTLPGHRDCWRLAIYTSRISEPGVTSKAGLSGASTTWMRSRQCPTPSISSAR